MIEADNKNESWEEDEESGSFEKLEEHKGDDHSKKRDTAKDRNSDNSILKGKKEKSKLIMEGVYEDPALKNNLDTQFYELIPFASDGVIEGLFGFFFLLS